MPGPIHDKIDDLPNLVKIVLGLLIVDLQAYLNGVPREINNTDDDGCTALWWAAARNDAYSVEILLRCGADAAIPNAFGQTVIAAACFGDADNVILQMLLGHQDLKVSDWCRYGCTALHWATWLSNCVMREQLIATACDQGLSSNHVDQFGETSLMLLAQRKSMAGAELLLSRGADIDAVDRMGNSAIFYAVWHKRPQNVQQLLDLGASYLITSHDGLTILHIAARRPHIGVLDILLKHGLPGLDIEARNRSVSSPA